MAADPHPMASPERAAPRAPGLREGATAPLAWASWRATLTLALAVLAVRVLFLTSTGAELAADEAHYWEWSRRLDLSYYSKGPGVAWLIALATAILPDAEWAVRLPAALLGFAVTLITARLATECSDGDERVGFLAAAAVSLFSGYQVMSLLMTIDIPFLACWALAAWTARRLFRSQEEGQASAAAWGGLALALGVGFLFKYTILLLVPGLLAYAVIERRRLRWDRRSLPHLAAGLAIFVATTSPVLLWNHRNGWPTVIHLIGNLALPGGDRPVSAARPWTYNPAWMPELIGSQLAILGPAAVLIGLAVIAVLRAGRRESPRWPDQLLMLWCGLPILVFYFLLSIVGKVQGNWPLAGYLTLFVLVAQLAVPALTRRAVDEAPRPGRTPFRLAWRCWILFGLATGVGVMAMPLLATVPGIGGLVPLSRVSGSRDRAAAVAGVLASTLRTTGREPILIANRYGTASLMAFYLPGHPTVYSAASFLGDRKSAYDFFADTDLRAPDLRGRPAVLVGGVPEHWATAFAFDAIATPRADAAIHVGWNYGGPRTGRGPGER